MGISFTQPLGLLLLALIPLTILLARNSMAALPRARRRFSLGLRLVLMALLVLAAGGHAGGAGGGYPGRGLPARPLGQRAPRAAGRRRGRSCARRRRHGPTRDQAGVVAFGAEALVDRPLSADRMLADITSKPASTFSNLADAIRLGTALFPARRAEAAWCSCRTATRTWTAPRAAARLAAARGVPSTWYRCPRRRGARC